MSWTTDLYAWLITCHNKIWTRQSSKQLESATETGQSLHVETEDSSGTCLDIGTRPLSKWWNSNFISKCPYTSRDSTFDIEQPPLMSSPPATPSYRNSTTTQGFCEVSLR